MRANCVAAALPGSACCQNRIVITVQSPPVSCARQPARASLSSSGPTLIYSTYLGGVGFDYGKGISLDDGGYVYVTGFTTSIDFYQIGIGVLFKDHLNNEILTFNSYMYDTALDFAPKNTSLRTQIKFNVPKIYPREYTISVSLSEGTTLNHIQQHWIHEATAINVQSKNNIDSCILTLYPDEIEYSYEYI